MKVLDGCLLSEHVRSVRSWEAQGQTTSKWTRAQAVGTIRVQLLPQEAWHGTVHRTEWGS